MTATDPTAPAQPATPGQALRWAAERLTKQVHALGQPVYADQVLDGLRRWADELDAAPATYSLPECPGCAAMVKRWHRKAAVEGLDPAEPPPIIQGAACRQCGGSPLSTAPPAGTGAQ